MGKADLHIHSTASDGSCSPSGVVELAKSKLLNTIAITDHDTIDGYLAAKKTAEELEIRLIPGVELTTQLDNREIHLLAYYIDSSNSALVKLLRSHRVARLNRMEQILDYLRSKKAIDVSLDEVKAQAKSNNVGRPHLAAILVKKKIVASFSEAFIRYLGSDLIDQIDKGFTDIATAIEIVKESGGVSVLAHPGRMYTEDEIKQYIDLGLDGIEAIHPSHNFEQQKTMTALAENNNLLVTGGSDFHGSGKRYDPYFGIVTLSERRVATLEQTVRNRRKLHTESRS